MPVAKNKCIYTMLLLYSLFFLHAAHGKSISKDELLSIVRQYHPVVKQADIGVQSAKARLLQTRGNFDPVLNTDVDRKTLDGKQYYNYINPQISIPTWYGIDLKAGIEEVSGDRVSPEYSIGQTSYAGIKFSANSLLFDARRATLVQAKLFCKQSEADRRLAINNILYDALHAYWNWVREYYNYSIISNAILVNEERLKFVRIEYEQGGRPAIDTTETLSQLQAFYVQQQAALLAYKNAGIELSGYLWGENNMPYTWHDEIVPDSNDLQYEFSIPSLSAVLGNINQHPKYESLSFKVNSLKVDQRLKAQSFIPKLSLNANMLSKGYYETSSLSAIQLENNHKVGATLSLPLFYRGAVGGYRQSKLKVLEMQTEQQNLALQLEIKVKTYYNEVLSLKKQIQTYSSAYDNYRKLYTGEKFRFDNGESSLFVLNSRENKLLEASQKLIELKTKWHKSYAGLLWAAGQLY